MDLGWIFERFLVDFRFILGSSSSSKRLKLANDMFYNSGIFLVAVGFIFGSSFSRLLLSCKVARPVIAEGDVDPAAPLQGLRAVSEKLCRRHTMSDLRSQNQSS